MSTTTAYTKSPPNVKPIMRPGTYVTCTSAAGVYAGCTGRVIRYHAHESDFKPECYIVRPDRGPHLALLFYPHELEAVS